MPDALVLNNGDTIRTASEWEEKRRPEIVELLGRVDNSVYPEINVNIELIVGTPANSDEAGVTQSWYPGVSRPIMEREFHRVSSVL